MMVERLNRDKSNQFKCLSLICRWFTVNRRENSEKSQQIRFNMKMSERSNIPYILTILTPILLYLYEQMNHLQHLVPPPYMTLCRLFHEIQVPQIGLHYFVLYLPSPPYSLYNKHHQKFFSPACYIRFLIYPAFLQAHFCSTIHAQ